VTGLNSVRDLHLGYPCWNNLHILPQQLTQFHSSGPIVSLCFVWTSYKKYHLFMIVSLLYIHMYFSAHVTALLSSVNYSVTDAPKFIPIVTTFYRYFKEAVWLLQLVLTALWIGLQHITTHSTPWQDASGMPSSQGCCLLQHTGQVYRCSPIKNVIQQTEAFW
jgi:CBS domain containing-hemolysin-like protein